MSATLPAGRYDAQARRRATRAQREKGCWVYIPAEELLRAGLQPSDERFEDARATRAKNMEDMVFDLLEPLNRDNIVWYDARLELARDPDGSY